MRYSWKSILLRASFNKAVAKDYSAIWCCLEIDIFYNEL